jgi:hypothetical protein
MIMMVNNYQITYTVAHIAIDCVNRLQCFSVDSAHL